MITFMGMMMAAGTEVSGTGASTVRIPSTESVDTILVASISAGSLKNDRIVFTMSLHTKCQCFQILKNYVHNLIFQLSEHFRDWRLSKTGLQCCILGC